MLSPGPEILWTERRPLQKQIPAGPAGRPHPRSRTKRGTGFGMFGMTGTTQAAEGGSETRPYGHASNAGEIQREASAVAASATGNELGRPKNVLPRSIDSTAGISSNPAEHLGTNPRTPACRKLPYNGFGS